MTGPAAEGAGAEQRVHQMGADEARTACDQRFHGRDRVPGTILQQ